MRRIFNFNLKCTGDSVTLGFYKKKLASVTRFNTII